MNRSRNFAMALISSFALLHPAGGFAQVVAIGSQEAALVVSDLIKTQPGIRTLQAVYTIDNRSVVAGVEKTYQQVGKVYYQEGMLCIIQEYVPGVPEKQVLYVGGECYRYFPLAHYGHRVLSKSMVNNRTDFGKYWWPMLTFLEGVEIPRAALKDSSMQSGPATILFKGDQGRELQARPKNSLLEYWGPSTDAIFTTDVVTGRLRKIERTHYRFSRSADDTIPQVYSSSVTDLGGTSLVGLFAVPTTILYAETMPNHQSAAREATVTLSSVVVNQLLPPDAFDPIWPADELLLDVEIQSPSNYDTAGGRLADLVMLADYHFGTLDHAGGLSWLTQYAAAVGTDPSPSQLAHLCRLHALARQQANAEQLYSAALAEARSAVTLAPPAEKAKAEMLLAHYITEYAFYQSKGRIGGSHRTAGQYLESEVELLVSPVARAFVAGRVADHYAMSGDIPRARAALSNVVSSLAGDAVATRWIDGWMARLTTKEGMNSSRSARWAKRERIRLLEGQIRQLETSTADAALLEQLKLKLETLLTQP
ncbi:MAG: hypothetical protein GXP29_02620 [Planctomycetes bacterium]|nr:hypothetical protein [Planctomycetota bacterium]